MAGAEQLVDRARIHHRADHRVAAEARGRLARRGARGNNASTTSNRTPATPSRRQGGDIDERLYPRRLSDSAGRSIDAPGEQRQQVGDRERDGQQRQRPERVPPGDVQDRLADGEGEQVDAVGHVAGPRQAAQAPRRLVGREDHEVRHGERHHDVAERLRALQPPGRERPRSERGGGERRPQRHPLPVHVQQRRHAEDRQQQRVGMGVAPVHQRADAGPARGRGGQGEPRHARRHDQPQPPQQQAGEPEHEHEEIGADLDGQRPQRAVDDARLVGREHAREPVGEVADRVRGGDRDHVVGDVAGGGAAAQVAAGRERAHERAEDERGQRDRQRQRGQDAERALA